MSNWKEVYASKVKTFDEAAALIKDNDRIWVSPASAAPIQLVEALQKRALAKEINGVHLVSGQMLVPFEFLKSAEHRPHLTYDTLFFGVLERKLGKFGNININSCQFSRLDKALEDAKINVCMTDVSEPDEDGYQKELINQYFYNEGFEAYMADEANANHQCSRSADFEEAVNAFIEKRKPAFIGK